MKLSEMSMGEQVDVLVMRLSKIGITIKLRANYPWIYLTRVNGNRVTEISHGEHGYTIGFAPIRKDHVFSFIDIPDMFRIIRKYVRLKQTPRTNNAMN
jgi:hypothetical protein